VKIDNSTGPISGLPSSEPRPKADKSVNTPSAAPGSKVELSSLASQMQEVEATLANVPVVDASRVAEIKQAMIEGRFQVNAEKVADGLIDSVREMVRAQPQKV